MTTGFCRMIGFGTDGRDIDDDRHFGTVNSRQGGFRSAEIDADRARREREVRQTDPRDLPVYDEDDDFDDR